MSFETLALAGVGLAVVTGIAMLVLALAYRFTRPPAAPAPAPPPAEAAPSGTAAFGTAFRQLDEAARDAAYERLGRQFVDNRSVRMGGEIAADFPSAPPAAPKAP